MFKKLLIIFFMTLIFIITGCATSKKSILLGTGIGTGVGAVIGGIATKDGKYRTRNVIIGAGVGSIAGAVTGAAIGESVEREKELSYLKGKNSSSNKKGNPPSLQEAKVESRWVEGRIIGNRYVEGHYEYIILEPTRWEAP